MKIAFYLDVLSLNYHLASQPSTLLPKLSNYLTSAFESFQWLPRASQLYYFSVPSTLDILWIYAFQ